LFACNKSKDATEPVIPPPPIDTLGTGWRKVLIPGEDFNDILFANNLVGYSDSRTGIYKTIDGGNTWTRILTKSLHTINFALYGESHAVFVSDHGKVYYTKNGGNTFDSVTISDRFTDAWYVSPTVAYILGNHFWKSNDGGSTWQKISTFPDDYHLRTLFFHDEQAGWATGPQLLKTTNGGLDWTAVTNGLPSSLIQTIHFPSASIGYVANGRDIYKTIDGGQTWNLKAQVEPVVYPDIHFVNDQTGHVVASSRILKTTDGGQTWIAEMRLTTTIVETYFTDASHGWATTEGGILKYEQ
jgi:photosystem II stability/assembly factor-like uncharacterized protein